jgi:hypothetical protein
MMNTNWIWVITLTGLLIIITLGGMLAFVSFNCSKDNYSRFPLVLTTTISNITQSSVFVGGDIKDDQGSEISSCGVCWSPEPAPGLKDHVIVIDTVPGKFNCKILGLSPNTIYYVRAFATNQYGTGYGEVISFRTSQNNLVTHYGLTEKTLYFRNCIQIRTSRIPVQVSL